MRRIALLVVFVCLFTYAPAMGQERDVDVDKETEVIMQGLIQRLEKIGLGELRESIAQDMARLEIYYKALDLAKQLKDKELIRDTNQLVQTTEAWVQSKIKFLESLGIELEEIEKKLKSLLKKKKKMKIRGTGKRKIV